MKYLIVILSLVILVSCGGKEEGPGDPLSDQQRTQIEKYCKALVKGFNNRNHELLKKSWNHEEFKRRIKDINKTQKSVLNHFYSKNIQPGIKYEIVHLVNEISLQGGKIYLSKITHHENYADLTLLLTLNKGFSFLVYSIGIEEMRPYIYDFYDVKENMWYSEKIREILMLNSKYDAYSPERQQANLAVLEADKKLASGDTLAALSALYDIPRTHWVGNSLSLKRINLAASLNDSIFTESLFMELESNESIYMEYLIALFLEDSAGIDQMVSNLKKETGCQALDSLIQKGYVWN